MKSGNMDFLLTSSTVLFHALVMVTVKQIRLKLEPRLNRSFNRGSSLILRQGAKC